MNKFDEVLNNWPAARMGEAAVKEACSFLNMYQSAIRDALTQAAEIERGDKVVVERDVIELAKKRLTVFEKVIDLPRVGKDRGILDDSAFHASNCLKDIKSLLKSMITASEGK